MLIRTFCFVSFIFTVVSCMKVENIPEYELNLSKTRFYFESENKPDTIHVEKTPHCITLFHIIDDEGQITYEHEYEDYLEIIEEKPDKIIFAIKRADYDFAIAVHILAEGYLQATDTAWYEGRYNLDFSNKIFYVADDVDYNSYIKYYDQDTKSEHSIRYIEDHDRLFDVCFSKGLIASEIPSDNVIEDIYGNTFILNEYNYTNFIEFINDSGDFVTNNFDYIKDSGVNYSIQSNNTLDKFLADYDDIDIRTTETDTIIFYKRPNSSYNKHMLSLYRNGDTIEYGELSKADIDISISLDGTTAYFSHKWSPSDIYRASLLPPYNMELILEDVYVNSICSNADGSSLIFNRSGSLEIYDHSTGDIRKIENTTINQSSNVIWE